MNSFFSSGGLGDAWIVLLKLLDKKEIYWKHFTSHEEHLIPIEQLQYLLPNTLKVEVEQIQKGNFDNQISQLKFEYSNIKKISTVAREIKNPMPNLDFLLPNKSNIDYIVIQPVAGRIVDSTLRYFHSSALDSITQNIKSDYSIILLGMGCDYDNRRCVNLSGRTSIANAINIVGQSKLFIGYHGFLAYVAMAFGIPSIIVWDIYNLPEHYMNKKWYEKTRMMWIPKYPDEPTIIDNADIIIDAIRGIL